MNCLLCQERFDTDMLNHVRLIHPEVLDQKARDAIMGLKRVTQRMNDEDWVCENCDRQFKLGQVFGEKFEGMFHDMPIVSLVCGECFWGQYETPSKTDGRLRQPLALRKLWRAFRDQLGIRRLP